MPRSTALRVLLFLLLGCSLITACSRLAMAYRNLDILIEWKLDQYIEMTDAQETRFERNLQQVIDWHCRTQLPLYSQWLGDWLASEDLSQAGQQQAYARIREARDALTRAVTPMATELLASLSEAQVRQLRDNLQQKREDNREAFLEPTQAEQTARRAERMQDRLEDWWGTLNPAQAARIRLWSRQMSDQNPLWLDNRTAWETALLEALQTRTRDDFPRRIADLLQHQNHYWTPAFRAAWPEVERHSLELLVDIARQSSPEQRQTLRSNLQDLREELDDLKCRPEA